jgi:hypothetical protein
MQDHMIRRDREVEGMADVMWWLRGSRVHQVGFSYTKWDGWPSPSNAPFAHRCGRFAPLRCTPCDDVTGFLITAQDHFGGGVLPRRPRESLTLCRSVQVSKCSRIDDRAGRNASRRRALARSAVVL